MICGLDNQQGEGDMERRRDDLETREMGISTAKGNSQLLAPNRNDCTRKLPRW